jgi:hypothetical protein
MPGRRHWRSRRGRVAGRRKQCYGALGHEAGFDDPYWVRDDGTRGTGDHGRVKVGKMLAVCVLSAKAFASLVHRKVHCPCRQVTKYDGPQPSIHSPDTFVPPNHFGRAKEPIVNLWMTRMPAFVEVPKPALSLKLGLDDV